MKKVVNKKAIKKEETSLDTLARLMVGLSEKMDTKFEQIDKRFEQMDMRFEQTDKRFEHLENKMDNGFFNVNQELKDHRERLERIEFKQNLTEGSKDELVYRSELKLLTKRVTALEKKK